MKIHSVLALLTAFAAVFSTALSSVAQEYTKEEMEAELERALLENRSRSIADDVRSNSKPRSSTSRSLAGDIALQNRSRSAFDHNANLSEVTPAVPAAVSSEPIASLELPNTVVSFGFDSHAIEPSTYYVLNNLAEILKKPKFQGSRLKISGHTDAVGDEVYNKSLSYKRAFAVSQYLTSAGIPMTAIEVQGYGEERLKDRFKPEAAENRRVEIAPY